MGCITCLKTETKDILNVPSLCYPVMTPAAWELLPRAESTPEMQQRPVVSKQPLKSDQLSPMFTFYPGSGQMPEVIPLVCICLLQSSRLIILLSKGRGF